MRSRLWFMFALFGMVLFLVPHRAEAGKKDGDVLKIFNGQRVYVITNAEENAPELADKLLDGCNIKERRVVTLREWNALPRETRWFVTCVYLIDRERLPISAQVPLNCRPENNETWTEVVRTGRDWGIAYDVTLSAPDRTNLRYLINKFRTLKESPRKIITESVRSLAVVPVGDQAEQAAQPFVESGQGELPPHILRAGDYDAWQKRLTDMDEVVLVDRSETKAGKLPTAFASIAEKLLPGNTDVVAWREMKPGGFVRAYVTAPNAGMLRAVLKKSPDNLLALAAFDKPYTLASARDLRPVRRVAVATVGGDRLDTETANRLAGYAASELRTINAFEVLERTGLTAVLAEIALDQAGLTNGANRAKVRQLAAADAVLIVDVSRSDGGTQYAVNSTRTTPPMGPAPSRPSEPSRLKTPISVGGKNGEVVRVLAEGLLGGVVGKKTDREYESDLRDYRRQTLPAWERSVADYNARAEARQIEWRQNITAQSTVRVAGSLRLVDLADGMVLWEVPILASNKAERTQATRTAYSIGENSAAPGASDLPGANGDLPGDLLVRTAEGAVAEAIHLLPGSAILPANTGTVEPATGGPATVTGKVIDVDGDSVLVGLGASDGLKVGDLLEVTTAGGTKLRIAVTRVRPRTCDAKFIEGTNPAYRLHVKIGDAAKPAVSP